MNSINKIKILVIRLSSLGDVLLTTPVLRALKKKFPSSEIHFLIKPAYADAIRFNPNLSKIYEYDKENVAGLINILKEENFDFIVDLHNNFRSRKISQVLGKKIYRFSKPSIKKWLLVKTKLNLLKDLIPIPVRYANSVDGLELDSKGLELFFTKGTPTILKNDAVYIGLCPGSQHFTKRWPKEYFIELGNELKNKGYEIVCFGGKDDEKICKEISNKIEGAINFQNENKLFVISSGMKECKAVISNDSGLMHAASALNIPVIAIFGSSVKEFGFMPYGVKNLILENNSLNCRPCSHIGKEKCPKKHFKCMTDITPGLALVEINNFLLSL